MGTQSLFSGLCSNSVTPSPKDLFPCHHSRFIQSNSRVSFRPQCFLASKRLGFVGRLDCKNCVENASNVVSKKEDSKSWVKPKSLAVFVSGGGSNFRSIHQACAEGSINGDVVVLVTNKHGNFYISLVPCEYFTTSVFYLF